MRLRKQIVRKMGIESVTGLRNEAYLEEHVAAQLLLAASANRPLSCIEAEINDLGLINTRYGRAFGDNVQRSVADLFLGSCGQEDVVCARGNGRFCIIMSKTDRHAANRLAKRLRAELVQRSIAFKGNEVNVSCSFGVADTCVAADESLIERAEAALLRASQNGRDSISVARPCRRQSLAA
jgi:two-component system cell cycle response regulator